MKGFVSSFEKTAGVNLWKGRIRAGISPSALKPPTPPKLPMPAPQTKLAAPINLWKGRIRAGVSPRALKAPPLPKAPSLPSTAETVAKAEDTAKRLEHAKGLVTPPYYWRKALREGK
jgi:hypothetical protein